MDNLYGYREQDVYGLVEFIENNKGKKLTTIFNEYAQQNKKSSGTIRNLYYAIVKKSINDETFKEKYCKNNYLSVTKKQQFSQCEAVQLVKKILRAKSKGISVRQAINTLANGDEKIALRLQNKYRVMLKTDREKVEKIARELSSSEGINVTLTRKTKEKISDFQFLRLKREIDSLVSNIAKQIKMENESLKQKVKDLTEENIKLSQMVLGGEKIECKTLSYFLPLTERKVQK